MLRVILLVCLFSGPAMAGAWLREPGEVFLAPSYTVEEIRGRTGKSRFAGLYAEWGMTPYLTLGADLGSPDGGEPSGVLFARLPLVETTQGIRAAFEVGIGVRDGPGSTRAFLRPGLSLGYGFGSRIGNGWLALDLSTEVDRHAKFDRHKADLTLGLSPNKRFKLMLQWHHEQIAGIRQNTVVPSIVWRTGERQFIQVGFLSGRGGRRAEGVKLSLWQEF
jgi:hypothetical protein